MNYKVGDKVRIVDHWVDGCHQNKEGGMDEWLGKVMTVAEITSWGSWRMKEDNKRWCWNDNAIAGLAEDFEDKVVITSNKKDTVARYYKDGKCVRKAAAHCHKDDDFDFKEGAKIAFNRLIDIIPTYNHEEPLAKAYVDEKVKTPVPQFQVGDRVEYRDNHTVNAFAPMLVGGEAGTVLEIKVVSDLILYLVKFDDYHNTSGIWVNDTLLTKRPKYYTAKIICVDNHHLFHWIVGKIYHVTDGKLENDDIPSCENKRYMSLKEINNTHFATFIEVIE